MSEKRAGARTGWRARAVETASRRSNLGRRPKHKGPPPCSTYNLFRRGAMVQVRSHRTANLAKVYGDFSYVAASLLVGGVSDADSRPHPSFDMKSATESPPTISARAIASTRFKKC